MKTAAPLGKSANALSSHLESYGISQVICCHLVLVFTFTKSDYSLLDTGHTCQENSPYFEQNQRRCFCLIALLSRTYNKYLSRFKKCDNQCGATYLFITQKSVRPAKIVLRAARPDTVEVMYYVRSCLLNLLEDNSIYRDLSF